MDAFVQRRASTSSSLQCDTSRVEPPRKRRRVHNDERGTTPSRQGSTSSTIRRIGSLPESKLDDDEEVASSAMVVPEIYYETLSQEAIDYDDPNDATMQKETSTATENNSSPERVSIYAEAFNTALKDVMKFEKHLFNDTEMAVFGIWVTLPYEAQYLYVRLFLRKMYAWHRCQQLGRYSEISDLEAALLALTQTRDVSIEGNTSRSLINGENIGKSGRERVGFVFVDSSEECIATVEEAVSLLSLSELKTMAKQEKLQGTTKAALQSSLVKTSRQQLTLASAGFHISPVALSFSSGQARPSRDKYSNKKERILHQIMETTGRCIRISSFAHQIFERVHLVCFPTSQWEEKPLTTMILARMSKRNFPDYIVSRTASMFDSRQKLLEFEHALRLDHDVDLLLESQDPVKEGEFEKVLLAFGSIEQRWRELVQAAQVQKPDLASDDSYLRRFSAAHVYTRIAHRAVFSLGRLQRYAEEHSLLKELLGQDLFHLARRGAWYQRKALIEEHYMHNAVVSGGGDPEQRKKFCCQQAVKTCARALEDPNCHLVYHYDLQKRILKLEKRLRIPRRLQHDFGHVQLREPEQEHIQGIQIVKGDGIGAGRNIGAKTVWLDESDNDTECSVEALCLGRYQQRGWKGFHSEGGIVRTLFAYLFYDILFLPVPNVFQTPYQTCPLDLQTDNFYVARASEINQRLAQITNGAAEGIVRDVHAVHADKRTCVIGLDWDVALEDIIEITQCFRTDALAAICKVLAQEYGRGSGGLPDLFLWRTEPEMEVFFVEVKSANDRLSDTQRLWIHVLACAGVRIAVCNVTAREVRHSGRK